MKYVIMCGGIYPQWSTPRQLTQAKDETLVERTIRLLKSNGITDIYISSSLIEFEAFGVPVIKPDLEAATCWIDGAFPILTEPVCYLFGDVMFSPEAIKTIVKTETEDVEFFASAPPFAPNYPKKYAEPFGFKVVNFEHFRKAIERTKELYTKGTLRRCIAWELWQVVKNTRLNVIDYGNYTVINDYTCDVDTMADAEFLTTRIRQYALLAGE